jgi:hypothetical protein
VINSADELLKSHAAEIEFERIPGAQYIQELVDLLQRTLMSRCASALKANALGSKHFPERHHAGVGGYFNHCSLLSILVHIIIESPKISIPHCGPVIQPMISLHTAFKNGGIDLDAIVCEH